MQDQPDIPAIETPGAPASESFLDRLNARLGSLDPADEGKTSEPSPTPDLEPALDSEPPPVEDQNPTEEPKVNIEDIDEDTLNLDAKAKPKWGELRKELKDARARLAELEKQSVRPDNSVATTDAIAAELEATKARLAEYEREISVVKVEASPEYKRLVTEPIESIIDSVESMAKAYSVDPEALVDAVLDNNARKQSEKLNDLIDSLPDRDRQRIYRFADDVLQIYDTDKRLREAATAAKGELEQRAAREAEQARLAAKREFQSTVEKTWDVFRERLAPVLSKTEADALYKDALESDYDTASTELKSYSVSAGVLLPHLVKTISAKDARIAELEKSLKSYQKATPKAGDGSTAAPAPSNVGFLEGVLRKVGR